MCVSLFWTAVERCVCVCVGVEYLGSAGPSDQGLSVRQEEDEGCLG